MTSGQCFTCISVCDSTYKSEIYLTSPTSYLNRGGSNLINGTLTDYDDGEGIISTMALHMNPIPNPLWKVFGL